MPRPPHATQRRHHVCPPRAGELNHPAETIPSHLQLGARDVGLLQSTIDLPHRLAGLAVHELFGACDQTPLGHGRPHAVTPPVTWRQLALTRQLLSEAQGWFERALVVDPTNPTIKLNLGIIAMAQRLRTRASQDR